LSTVTTDPGAASPRYADAYARILEACVEPRDLPAAMRSLLAEVRGITGCEAGAVRLRDLRGDYPIFVQEGLPELLIRQESSLARRDADGHALYGVDGHLELAGVCGAVARSETDPLRPFFTAGGSFWTNSGQELPGGAPVAGDLQGTGLAHGHRSVALVPLPAGRTVTSKPR
jgi:hypothetical protein